MDFQQNIDTYAKDISCIPQVTQRSPNLSGKGVIIAVLDSGIDYFSPEFRFANGKSCVIIALDTGRFLQSHLLSVALCLSRFINVH